MDFITEKIMEKPDPTAKPAIDFDNKICAEREKQIKVIVPNSTAGMIIGNGYMSFVKNKFEVSKIYMTACMCIFKFCQIKRYMFMIFFCSKTQMIFV